MISMKQFEQIIIGILFVASFCNAGNPYHFNEEKRLREELFVKRKSRQDFIPVEELSDIIVIKLGINIIHLTNLDAEAGILTLRAFLRMSWNNTLLKWNMHDYGGIEYLTVPSDLMWKPDISVYNLAGGTDPLTYSSTMAILRYDGRVIWVPPLKLRVMCEITSVTFPYDVHKCFVKLGSWTQDGFQLDVQLSDDSNDANWDYYDDTSNEWEIIGSKSVRHEKYYSCCEEPYPDVTFQFTIRRRSPYYTITMVIPCMLFLCLTLVSFWLPPMAGEKILLGGFNVLYLIILLSHMNWAVPKSFIQVPSIIRLCGSITLLSIISLVTNVITVSMSRKRDQSNPPSCCQLIAKEIIVKLCCLPRNEIHDNSNLLSSNSEQREDKEQPEIEAPSTKPIDWSIVALMVDRTLFYVALVALSIILWYSFSSTGNSN